MNLRIKKQKSPGKEKRFHFPITVSHRRLLKDYILKSNAHWYHKPNRISLTILKAICQFT